MTSTSTTVFLSLVMRVLLAAIAMMVVTIPTTYIQQVDAFQNSAAASFMINHNINNQQHHYHYQISRASTVSSSSSTTSLSFQKAPAVAEAIKQSKEKEEDKGEEINNVMTLEDEEILFGQDELNARHPPFPQRHRSVSNSGNLLEDPYSKSKQSKLELALDYSSTDPLK